MRGFRVGARLVEAWRRFRPKTAMGWVHVATGLLCAGVVVAQIVFVLASTFKNPRTLGFHDWDQMESHRYLVVKTIRAFHQFPFWNPYACGGHPAWGGFESDETVISPWAPAYLFAPLGIAMRVEMVGSAVLGAAGAWLLASRFTKSRALRAFAAVVFAIDGRWTLQMAVGHTWHLAYAWTPWVFYFFDRAADDSPGLARSRKRDLILCGVSLAMMVYTGGIYPLPETAFALVLYAGFLALLARSVGPLVRVTAAGVLGIGFAAPRFLPVLEVMRRYPRLTDSTEYLDPMQLLQVLISRDQNLFSNPAHVAQWGWHEWGMYIGLTALAVIVAGAITARGVRDRAMRIVAAILLVLGLGRFHEYSPWALLHQMPVFSSQHVPSRWLYPSALLFCCVAAAAAERLLLRLERGRWALEILFTLGVAWVAYDVGSVARQPILQSFQQPPPTTPESTGEFVDEDHLPASLNYDSGAWSAPSLTAEMANIGTIDCSTFPGLNSYIRGADGRTPGLGAYGKGSAGYKGEAYVAEGHGKATLVSFTPNVMDVLVEGATPGDHVVLNQNWDAGWRADGSPALNWADAVAAPITSPTQTVRFRFVPKTLWWGIASFVLTVAGLVVPGIVRRRQLRAAK